MIIKVFQIDFVDFGYEPQDVYSEMAPFLNHSYLARIEVDGNILAKEQVKIIGPKDTRTFLTEYRVDGSRLETLVASKRPFDQDERDFEGGLPCHLTKDNAMKLKSLMARNHWDHYFCLAQTQMLIGTTDPGLSRLKKTTHGL